MARDNHDISSNGTAKILEASPSFGELPHVLQNLNHKTGRAENLIVCCCWVWGILCLSAKGEKILTRSCWSNAIARSTSMELKPGPCFLRVFRRRSYKPGCKLEKPSWSKGGLPVPLHGNSPCSVQLLVAA